MKGSKFSRIRGSFSLGSILALATLLYAGAGQPTLHLIGDSTMADQPVADTPERGWGQVFPAFFNSDLRIVNHARNGRSTKRFIDEGLWDQVLGQLHQGDFVFIQFGHNDAKISDTTRYAAPRGAYRENLIRFVADTRQAGATPILITPVCRRKFSTTGEFIDGHGDYPDVVRQVSRAYKVPLIDLHARSLEWLVELGPAVSDSMFMNAPPGVYKKYPEGKNDNTHFNKRGAVEVALLVLGEMELHQIPPIQYCLVRK